jgi:hypothetical protein
MLKGLEELADHIKEKIAEARPAPKSKPGKPGKPDAEEPPAQASGNPFDFD